ncbi:hypothetical protein L5515_019637 [Caenorhabditis briggsae]|uniref:Uncharacterized protein n=1 Tax=Caenorhabditis briggsae TaxID=6238 RepID=A0AAE9FJS3_CAEBR|nr:hypothetical protein L5515_019634 [Caenorhabditis briggsae]UMM44492.1 hypothetical protein L5515_019637 [Caenorhabditis briggsae]
MSSTSELEKVRAGLRPVSTKPSTKIEAAIHTEKGVVKTKAEFFEKKIKEMSLTKEELEKMRVEKEKADRKAAFKLLIKKFQ